MAASAPVQPALGYDGRYGCRIREYMDKYGLQQRNLNAT
jgi:hypothetical protein